MENKKKRLLWTLAVCAAAVLLVAAVCLIIRYYPQIKGLMQPETFPEHPFDTIPHDCRSDFLGDGHTDAPRITGCTKTNKHNEVFGKKTATLIITECEIGPPEQSMPTRPG